ncbi:dolichyl pyrophosphate Man9GlcNAc2 alpha-1,3-glucosyltransferase-like isoform X2 [Liolophura sinensis]
MFGDYEAQRHWMEITYNLPVKDWYENTTQNDLLYWGLDYPPLTAYHSYLCGMVSNWLNPEWVALNRSRGYESYQHKLFMRYSVLLADILIYFPALLMFFTANKTASGNAAFAVLCALIYPGLALIDYGHFQYNSVSLGLTVWAVMSLSKGHDLLGSIAFCLALNYKQMELYHAMPFFCYLLGSTLRNKDEIRIFKLAKIGVVVLGTFAICWLPFLNNKESALQVLQRLFPFGRGLYEDKVANVWCSVTVLVKLKQILTVDSLIKLCFCSTLVGLIPSSINLLFIPSIQRFKLALINSALVFFLFSFQVHEKSILIAALPVCLSLPEHPLASIWFLLISVSSMFPLLVKDQLVVPYFGSMLLFTIVTFLCLKPFETETFRKNKSLEWSMFLCFVLSVSGAQIQNVLSLIVRPPPTLPDLFPVLISVY